MSLFIDDEFWKQFGDIVKDNASENKVFPENGVGFIYGLPATRKTTIAIDTVKSMKNFVGKYYIDCDSKSVAQAKETYSNLMECGFKYRNSLLEGKEPISVVREIMASIEKANDSKRRCLIIDTWHQLIEKEDNNEIAKSIMKDVRSLSFRFNTLIIFIAHVGKNSDDIRGASAVSGDATFKVLVSKSEVENEYMIRITKDSLGLLKDSSVIMTKVGSISDSVLEYSAETKQKGKGMKPKEALVTATLIAHIQEKMGKEGEYSIGTLREWLYGNFNIINKLKPEDELFCKDRFLKDNFVDITEAVFKIKREGRSKYIVGFIYEDDEPKDTKDEVGQTDEEREEEERNNARM